MDFSEYGIPSHSWLAFASSNPAAANDGFTGNDLAQAAELRRTANESRAAVGARLLSQSGLNSRVIMSTTQIPSRSHDRTIPLRIYQLRGTEQSRRRSLIYFHGGGMLFGSETTDDFLCATIAATTGLIVLSVIYRHTPEHRHPAQHNDAWDAYTYICKHGPDELCIDLENGLGVLGISAGGALAAGLVLRELALSRRPRDGDRGKSMITAAILSIPWLLYVNKNYPYSLFKSPEKSSRIQCVQASVIPRDRLDMFTQLFEPYGHEYDQLLNIAISSDEQLKCWPSTSVIVAGMDPLRDDGLLFARKLESLGTPLSVDIFPGLPHGFRRWPDLEATKKFDACQLDAIRWTMQLVDTEGTTKNAGWREHW